MVDIAYVIIVRMNLLNEYLRKTAGIDDLLKYKGDKLCIHIRHNITKLTEWE